MAEPPRPNGHVCRAAEAPVPPRTFTVMSGVPEGGTGGLWGKGERRGEKQEKKMPEGNRIKRLQTCMPRTSPRRHPGSLPERGEGQAIRDPFRTIAMNAGVEERGVR